VPFKANAARRHHIPKQRHKMSTHPVRTAAMRMQRRAA
jgi:hypothetical protein